VNAAFPRTLQNGPDVLCGERFSASDSQKRHAGGAQLINDVQLFLNRQLVPSLLGRRILVAVDATQIGGLGQIPDRKQGCGKPLRSAQAVLCDAAGCKRKGTDRGLVMEQFICHHRFVGFAL